MNKLTEIKEALESNTIKPQRNYREYMEYLLSLLEEKDKALTFYASYWNHEVKHEDTDTTSLQKDRGERARTALNSSNNEGDTP